MNDNEELAVTAWNLKDYFTTHISKYKYKKTRKCKLRVGGEELSENEQNLGDIIERSEESKRKLEQRLKKDCLIPKRIPKRKKKTKAHEMRTKAMERFGETKKI